MSDDTEVFKYSSRSISRDLHSHSPPPYLSGSMKNIGDGKVEESTTKVSRISV